MSLEGLAWPVRSTSLVFIDETTIKTNVASLRGWSTEGRRLTACAQHGRWRKLTFVGALRCDGLTAPCFFDGPMINDHCFRAYAEQLLIPTHRPGDIVLADDLGSAKSKAVRETIRAAGARLGFLPEYSPDLNPIEQAFAKIKHWMRMAHRRDMQDVWRHLASLLGDIPRDECQNYLRNAGYASAKT